MDKIEAIHAIDLDTSLPYLQVNSRYESGTEMVSKTEIMASYNADETIAIGDSITDWKMALAASIVFARSPLTDYLDENKKPYLPWNDFVDIHNTLLMISTKSVERSIGLMKPSHSREQVNFETLSIDPVILGNSG
jgi:2-hydroxy-3-keto-5-methylthiopentenyl-1-phosphate phosphatase